MTLTDESDQSPQPQVNAAADDESTTPTPSSSNSGSRSGTEGNTTHASCGTTGQMMVDIASSTSSSPCQPVGVTFPVTYFSKKARCFNPDWYKIYPWLEYSVKKDAAFCYPCRLFGTGCALSSRPERAFTSIGFRDWKHATGQKGILVSHNNSLSHKQAVVAWEQFKATQDQGSIVDQLGTNRAQQISKNKHYITTIAEVLLLCSRQEISFRGHDESDSSMKKGNFLEVLALIASMTQLLTRGSFTVQEMLNTPHTAFRMISFLRQICASVQRAKFYSLMVDETKDRSKQEQMSIVI